MTEFGFETNPPDPFSGVPLAAQAQFNTIGEYQAWQNPRIQSQAQFLLRDVAPVKKHRKRVMLELRAEVRGPISTARQHALDRAIGQAARQGFPPNVEGPRSRPARRVVVGVYSFVASRVPGRKIVRSPTSQCRSSPSSARSLSRGGYPRSIAN